MRTRLTFFPIAVALLAICLPMQAQPTAHYPVGIHGINAATLPPPGFYLRDYNLFYTADHLNGPSGNQTAPANFDALTYATILRPIWITDAKVLGGCLGVDMVVPLVYRQLRAGKFDDNSFGLGDILPETTLSWHPAHFDFCAGVGEWMPTGDFAPKPTTRAGLGFWETMFTLGGTWYVDPGKTWSLSALNRYEINGEQRDTHTTTGNAWTVEWGLAKSITKSLNAGLVGYYQAKITSDTGALPQPLNRVAAIGPELAYFFPSQHLMLSLRYDYEFMAESRAQGHTVAFVLTKRF